MRRLAAKMGHNVTSGKEEKKGKGQPPGRVWEQILGLAITQQYVCCNLLGLNAIFGAREIMRQLGMSTCRGVMVTHQWLRKAQTPAKIQGIALYTGL